MRKNYLHLFLRLKKLKLHKLKKVFLLATAGLLLATASFADGGKKKKSGKEKSCCSKDKAAKGCSKDKESKTAKM